MKELTKLMNAIADAWNEGRAPWAYDEKGHSAAVKAWNRGFQADAEAGGLAAVVALVTSHGLGLYRGKLIESGGAL